ncbi:MAG: putative porin [Candidatus Auribacterota bacterium]|jgi:hypothetical protein|nr:putative porin [Candidatus Auribacterota bacterium]
MKKLAYCLAVFLLSSPALVHAQKNVSDLKETVVKQSEMIDMLMGKVKSLEEKKYTTAVALPSNLEQIAPKAQWTERMRIKGDFRYRHELIDVDERRHNTTQAERDSRATVRNRHRIRARVALHAEINEDIDFIFQLATGSSSPATSHQTLDTFFESKNIYVDLAYVIWHPEEFFSVNTKGFEMYAGKMKNPFYTPVDSEMIWDGSIRPEGIAGTYATKINCVELCATAGGFWVDEQERDVDVNLWGIQGYFKAPVIHEGIKLVGGMTYYDYGAIQDHPVYTASGNSTYSKPLDPAVRYLLDYQILEGFTELHWNMFEMPWIVYGQFVANMATKDDDNAFQFGVKLNKCKKPGSWEFQYFYRRLEADAIVGAFTEGCFGAGMTDSKGNCFKAGYQLSKNTKLCSALFLNRTGLEDHQGKKFTLLQIDLNVKF